MRNFLRVPLFTMLALLFGPSSADGQEIWCPDEYVCLTKEEAAQVKANYKILQCLKDELDLGLLKVTDDPFAFFYDRNLNFYGPDQLVTRIQWCGFDFKIKRTLHLEVSHKQPSVSGFDFKLRLAVQLEPYGALTSQWFQPALQAELWHYSSVHLFVGSSLQSLSLGAALDLTRTVSLGTGLLLSYGSWGFRPLLGVSLALW